LGFAAFSGRAARIRAKRSTRVLRMRCRLSGCRQQRVDLVVIVAEEVVSDLPQEKWTPVDAA
jgi:hypothetical protein